MRTLLALALIFKNAGLFASSGASTISFAAARRDTVRSIDEGKIMLPEDSKDPFTAELMPMLEGIKHAAQNASTPDQLEEAKARFEVWKVRIFAKHEPRGRDRHGVPPPGSQEGPRASSLDALKQRLPEAPDAQALDLFYENGARTDTGAMISPAPAAPFRNEALVQTAAHQARAAAVPPAPPLSALASSDFNKVVDYLASRRFPRQLIQLAIQEARRQAADPLMVLAVIQAESSFEPGATSRLGAVGLMQITPDTGRQLGVQDESALYDPLTNLKVGVKRLKNLWNEFSDIAFSELDSINPYTRADVQKAISAYNAGPGAVRRYGIAPPYRETRLYIMKVLRNYAAMRRRLDERD